MVPKGFRITEIDINHRSYRYRQCTNQKFSINFQFLLENEITPNVCLYGKGLVGGLIATVAVTRQPELFTATVLEDPIVDIIEYLSTNDDAFNKKVFGDINEKDIYEHIKRLFY